MHQLPPPLAPLGAFRQFIVCRFVPSSTRAGKTDKFPIDVRSGKVASAHDPAVWLDAATACATAAAWGPEFGVGFVFTQADPFWFLDVDECAHGGQWSPLALQLLGMFPGAAVEVSHSGRGLHVFGMGAAPAHKCKNVANGLEFYTDGRFVALTGTHAQGSAATDHTQAVHALVTAFFQPDEGTTPADWTEGPCEGWRGPDNDEDLVRRALRSQSAAAAFGNGASFADLWTGNVEALARAYPDPSRPFDASSADAALAQHLAFWTGKDCARIQRLMASSALVREKWARDDYLPRTILGAVARQRDILQDKAPEPVHGLPALAPETNAAPVAASMRPEVTKPEARPVTGSTFLGAEAQAALFAGCVYVVDAHKVMVPGGDLLKPEQFRVRFGGYTFAMDLANERTTRDAWEAFTQSQALRHPVADSSTFRPLEAPGTLLNEGGRILANTWWPIDVPRAVGDMEPFFTHLVKLLPDERDRLILLSYMAACVQHKGHKFQWAPLLQGTEGNGKTLFTRCVAFALGHRYVHLPPASEIAEKYNTWMFGTLLIGVEDVYVPEQKRELLEILKPMITGDRLTRRDMGVAQRTTDCCANFMFNSNHRDALRKSRTDRRLAIFYTAQQRAEDLARDGMTGGYFPRLYAWLKSGGYAIVSEFLHTWPIPDQFNPTTQADRAPKTSSNDQAIEEGMGAIEQEVLEAIEQGLPGFCGGWVSSLQLEHLLNRVGKAGRLAPNKRRELLQSLGFDWHPGLPKGRVHNAVMPDGAKPKLFIKEGHADAQLRGPDIARAYTAAQAMATPAKA